MKVALLQLEMESMAASLSSGTALMLVARRSSVMVELSTERGVDLLGSSSTLVPRARPLSAIQGRYRGPLQITHLPKREGQHRQLHLHRQFRHCARRRGSLGRNRQGHGRGRYLHCQRRDSCERTGRPDLCVWREWLRHLHRQWRPGEWRRRRFARSFRFASL